MEKSNPHWIVDIEELLVSGLSQVVPGYYKETYDVDSYLGMIEVALPRNHAVPTPISEEQQLDYLDARGWLKLIVYDWNKVFRNEFREMRVRNWAGELIDVRNQKSHGNKVNRFTDEQTLRAAETAGLLLEAMGASEEAFKVNEIKKRLGEKHYEKVYGGDEREKRQQLEEEKQKLEELLTESNKRVDELSIEFKELEPFWLKLKILVELIVRLQQHSLVIGDDGELVHPDIFSRTIMSNLRLIKEIDESYELPAEFGELSQEYELELSRLLETEAEVFRLSSEYHEHVGHEESSEFKSSTPPDSVVPHVEHARVLYVNNGDSIDVELNGERHRVRYIGINALEGCRDANAQLVEGRTVSLVRDVSDTDRYGRLLRYVFVDEIFVNEVLLRDGYARASIWKPDTRFEARFRELEDQAQNPHGDDFQF